MLDIHFTLTYIQLYFIIINLITFILYGYDKVQAIRDQKGIKRVSEARLLLLAFLGGSIAALIAMLLFRHKIKKVSFLIKYFVVLILDLIIWYFIYIYKY